MGLISFATCVLTVIVVFYFFNGLFSLFGSYLFADTGLLVASLLVEEAPKTPGIAILVD